MTQEEQKVVEEFTKMNLTKKGLYHYNDMQDAFLIGLFKGEKMQLSLPSNLDEAAKKIVIQLHPSMEYSAVLGYQLTMGELVELVKAGVEWMAGQGASFNTKVGWIDGPTILDWPDDVLDKFEMGNEVIVQIRKKQ